MIFFILSVFTVYGGVHVYAFLRARNAFAFGIGTGVALALFLFVMTVSPFLIRALELHDYERTARTVAYLAYLWMAVLFLFFCYSLVFDLIGLTTRAAGWMARRDVSSLLIPARTAFVVSLAFACALSLYGYYEALDIRTERLRIETGKLPPGIERLTIVQISDVHLGLIVRSRRLEKILDAVTSARPDILVSTGDLVDAQINHLTGLAELLRGIKTTYGNYAVTGNHEFYAGLDKALAFTREAGFTVLRNEAVSAGPITIAGVDDPAGVQRKLQKSIPEKELFKKVPRDRFILFLKHRPLIDQSSPGLFDLQISGHTHKGQIFPFTLITLMTFPLNAGTYDVGKGSLLHVSRGAGTWGSPVRLLAPPEVTVIELVSKASASVPGD